MIPFLLKQLLLLFVLGLCILSCKGQHKAASSTSDRKVYTFVETPPQFPGGQEALLKYLSKNLNYPKSYLEDRASGSLSLSFIVEADGSINTNTITNRNRPIDTTDLWEAEVLRVVRSMPGWNPGKHNGKKVAVQFSLPIRICLQE